MGKTKATEKPAKPNEENLKDDSQLYLTHCPNKRQFSVVER